jgi:hypothetical protein
MIAWGVETMTFVQKFDPKLIRCAYNKLTILGGVRGYGSRENGY